MTMSALAGRRIIVTRPDPGLLGDLLRAAGAEVIHLPLIATVDPPDAGAGVAAAVADLAAGEWVLVTSPEGARRVLAARAGSLWEEHPEAVRVAAVGAATAAEIQTATGRRVDLIPQVQTAAALAEAMAELPARQRILVVHGDLADPSLVAALERQGHQVRAVVGYRTVLVTPDSASLAAARGGDAVVLASGSAARAWAQSCRGVEGLDPAVVCSIGPSTTAVAREHGLRITHQAEVSSVEGIMACLNQAFDPDHPTMG